MPNVSQPTLDLLTELRDDSALPAPARAAAADMLDRWQAGRELYATLKADQQRLTSAYATWQREHPRRLIAALASPPVPLALIDSDRAELAAAMDTAATRVATVDRALNLLSSQVERCLAGLAPELLPYVAEHRAALPMSAPVPDRVAYAWRMVSRAVHLHLPLDALLIDTPSGPQLLTTKAMHLELSASERHYWAWCAIRAGQAQVTADQGRVSVTITASWQQRTELYASEQPALSSLVARVKARRKPSAA